MSMAIFAELGKRKGDGIPLLIFGRNGAREVWGWWGRWIGGRRKAAAFD
jgi:hypothetical protein